MTRTYRRRRREPTTRELVFELTGATLLWLLVVVISHDWPVIGDAWNGALHWVSNWIAGIATPDS